MAQELNIEQKLNDLLETHNFHPEFLGKDGRPVKDASTAKTFSFDYIGSSGNNYGTMVIVLGDDNEMFVMYGDNLGKTIEDHKDRNEFFEFQHTLTNLAHRNRWHATLTDISKLKHIQAGIAAITEGLFEGYYGNKRVSYAGEPTEARLMLKHNRVLGENDARFRYVESIFIETADGERFKLPFTNLGGGRAMLEHVKQGGKPYDIRGNHICEMVGELKVLSRFNRASAGRVMEGVTQEIVEQAKTYYKNLREHIKRMSTHRGYSTYFESWHPAESVDHEKLVEDIKTMFIEQTLDTRIEDALPLLARIQQGNVMKEADIFESWIDHLSEGTWNLPETPEQLTRLKQLMSKELIVGPDATNATEQLYDLVGDDMLFDRLIDLADRDPRANAWDDTEVMSRLSELGIQTPESDTMTQPESDPAVADPMAAPGTGQQQGVAEGGEKDRQWSNKDMEKLRVATRDFDNILSADGPDAFKQELIKKRIQTKPMAGPKGVLPEQGMAEGADDNFSVANKKVEDLVDKYRLYDKRGWTELFAKLAGRKLEVAEIRREMEYASKFLQLLDSIRMRSDYQGQQGAQNDQELIDLSNQWLSLFNKATSEFKAMSGQGVAEGALNELSVNTLSSYGKKAEKSNDKKLDKAADHSQKATKLYDKGTASAVDKSFDHEDQANKLHKQVNQRDASMDRAAAKLGNKFRKGVGEQWEPVSGYDTVYPRAEVIKNKNGKPIGEIYQDTYGWGCFHYKADNGADGMSNREEALEQLKDMHNEHRQQGVAEGENFATFEDIHSLTKLAGIPVAESRLMDATGETIDHILDRFKYEVRNFEATDDLDDDLYDALSDYYSNKGDMPYRIMRMSGRTDDPYEWVSDQLAKHLGIKGVAREGVLGTVGGAMLGSVMGPVGAAVGGVAGQEMTKGGSGIVEGSCNQTMEGEYCPEHGLMECGMAEGADDTNMGVLGKMVGAGIPKPSDFAAGFNKTFESRESDVLLARIKSLALIR